MMMFLGALFFWVVGGLALEVRDQCNQVVFDINSIEAAHEIENCTTLAGLLQIDLSNMNGTLHLDNIHSILGHVLIHTYADDLNQSMVGAESTQDAGLSMRSLKVITGRLEASYVWNLVNISFPSLDSVSQIVYLHNLPRLETVILPALDKVGAFMLDSLPALRTIQMDRGISDVTGYQNIESGSFVPIDAYVVVQNTAIERLDTFNFSTVAVFQITNNTNLESIVMALKETHRAGSWSMTTNEISGNGNGTTTLSLPHLWRLDTEFNEFHDLAQLEIPRLKKIWGSLLIGDNKNMETLYAPRLLEITKELIIEWNPKLSSIIFTVLRDLNSMVVQGTKALENPDGLSLPNLGAVKEVYLGGDDSQVSCQVWDNKRCTGLVTHVYNCGSNWKSHRHIDVAPEAAECRFTYPAHGWTRAKKLRVSLRVVVGSAVLTAVLFSSLLYCWNQRGICFRSAMKDAMTGDYFKVKDEDEEGAVEIDAQDVERSRAKDRLLPEQPAASSSSRSKPRAHIQ